MMGWAWWAAGGALLLWMLLASWIRVLISFTRLDGNDELTVDAHALFGLVKLRYTIPIMRLRSLQEGLELKTERVDKNENEMNSEREHAVTLHKIRQAFANARLLLEHCFQFNEWLRGVVSRVRCTSLVWNTAVGLSDAAQTAIATGVLWSLKTSLLSWLLRRLRLETQPRLKVMPAFNQWQFTTELLCKLQIRLGTVLFAGFRLLVRIAKTKGGIKTWQRVLFRA